MANYHINPETGTPAKCRAIIRSCRFGEHYPSAQSAEAAYAQEHDSFATLSKAAPALPPGYFASEDPNGRVVERVDLGAHLQHIEGFVPLGDVDGETMARLRRADAELELYHVANKFRVGQVLAGEAMLLNGEELTFYGDNEALLAALGNVSENIYNFTPANEHQRKFHLELLDAVVDSLGAAKSNSGVARDPLDFVGDVEPIAVNASPHEPGRASDFDAGWATGFVTAFGRMDQFGLDGGQTYDAAVASYLAEEMATWEKKLDLDDSEFNDGAHNGLYDWRHGLR